jgi:succinate dehydrogenase/fumarate reductase flavoprotein subunit
MMPDYDVLVVGSGISGLCASLEAVNAGARVLLVDSEEELGGSSRLSTGMIMGAGTRFQKQRGIDDSPEALYRHYMTLNQWKVQQSVAKTLCYEVGPSIEWLNDIGVEILDVYFSGDELVPRGHVTHGGAAIIEVLAKAVRGERRIDVALSRRVNRLLVEDDRVVGVAVGDDEVRASATVLATGGIGANRDLMATYLPAGLAVGHWYWYLGAESSRGDAMLLGRQVGAQIVGTNRGQFTIRPNFGRYPDTYFPGWLVIVNQLGRRFYDEMSPYSVAQVIYASQPPGGIWAIFDEESKRESQPGMTKAHKKVNIPGETEEDWAEPTIDAMVERGLVHVASSLERLAALINVPEKNLLGTVRRYNRHVGEGCDADYLKEASHLRPVATPPFYATELRPYMLGLTCVGPRIDERARVIAEDSDPIPGLWAAGECCGGVLGDIYAGSGNSLANCLTFGRIAGRSAAGEALRS